MFVPAVLQTSINDELIHYGLVKGYWSLISSVWEALAVAVSPTLTEVTTAAGLRREVAGGRRCTQQSLFA